MLEQSPAPIEVDTALMLRYSPDDVWLLPHGDGDDEPRPAEVIIDRAGDPEPAP